MTDRPKHIFWEQVRPDWWNSNIGYVSCSENIWTGFVYRNTRTGEAWVESKTGFRTAARAIHWVEDQAEA